MDPIVSPWFIYFYGLVGNLSVVMTTLFVISIFAIISYFVGSFIYYVDDKETSMTKWRKRWKPWLYVIVGIWFLSILLPSRPDILAMYIANRITYNAVGTAIKDGKLLKDELKKDVIDIINGVVDGKQKRSKE